MDQNLPGTSAWHQAQARRTERDQRIQDSPTRRRIASPSGPGPGSGPLPAPLQYQNLPAHLAQQLAALPSLQPVGGRGRGRGRGQGHGHIAPAPAPAPAPFHHYGHLPPHLQQQLALLPTIPTPVQRGYTPVRIIIYQFG
jgi:hypothetical protein